MLIVQSFGSDFAPYSSLSAQFRADLSVEVPGLQLREVTLQVARNATTAVEEEFVAYLRALVKADRPDLVVLLDGPAARFGLEHHGGLFASAPFLLAGVDVRVIRGLAIPPGCAVVAQDFDFGPVVENILSLLPETEEVAVVFGTSWIERLWREELERELRPFEGRIRLAWWDGLPLQEMAARAAKLPPRSAILYALLLVDGAGAHHSSSQVLGILHGATAAPIFGLYDTQLGMGIVGGPLMSVSELSRRSVAAAAAILRGAPPSGQRPAALVLGDPVFDWRELRRWGIADRRLPPGGRVRFRPPPIWTLYRVPVLGGAALIVVLATLVVALDVNRLRRRAAEREVRVLNRRLLSAFEDERRHLGRELHDDVSQRLARLAIDVARVERGGTGSADAVDLRSVREEIVVLSADIHALSRRLHPTILDDLGLVEAVRAEVENFARGGSITVNLRLAEPEGPLSRDAALSLYRVVQEALRNVARHARAGSVEISLRPSSGGYEVEVRDDGVGFDPAARRGTGIGLSSMRERMRLVGGRLSVSSEPRRGTSVVVWAPLEGGEP